MSIRKIKRRAQDRIGKYPRCIWSKREHCQGRYQRVSAYYAPLVHWVQVRRYCWELA